MATIPDAASVETGDEFIHIRYRDHERFERERTPDWAARTAEAISADSEVRMGRRESGDWAVQSVLVRKHFGGQNAREQADQVVREIEQH